MKGRAEIKTSHSKGGSFTFTLIISKCYPAVLLSMDSSPASQNPAFQVNVTFNLYSLLCEGMTRVFHMLLLQTSFLRQHQAAEKKNPQKTHPKTKKTQPEIVSEGEESSV